jgi:hypothetical protein
VHAAGNCFFIINRSIFLIAARGAPGFAEIDAFQIMRLSQTLCFKDIPGKQGVEAKE